MYYPEDEVILETEKLYASAEGMTEFIPGQVKLFADGAMFSQLMQMSEGYLDGHHGEWLMEPEVFARAFQIYWDAGYQIHVHQNGDAGLDLVLDHDPDLDLDHFFWILGRPRWPAPLGEAREGCPRRRGGRGTRP